MRPNLFLARVLYGNSNNIVNFASRVINQRNLQSMNNQFSPKISEVLIYSKEEALRLHNECVAPEHLLLGLIRDGEGHPNPPLAQSGLPLGETTRRAIHTRFRHAGNA